MPGAGHAPGRHRPGQPLQVREQRITRERGALCAPCAGLPIGAVALHGRLLWAQRAQALRQGRVHRAAC